MVTAQGEAVPAGTKVFLDFAMEDNEALFAAVNASDAVVTSEKGTLSGVLLEAKVVIAEGTAPISTNSAAIENYTATPKDGMGLSTFAIDLGFNIPLDNVGVSAIQVSSRPEAQPSWKFFAGKRTTGFSTSIYKAVLVYPSILIGSQTDLELKNGYNPALIISQVVPSKCTTTVTTITMTSTTITTATATTTTTGVPTAMTVVFVASCDVNDADRIARDTVTEINRLWVLICPDPSCMPLLTPEEPTGACGIGIRRQRRSSGTVVVGITATSPDAADKIRNMEVTVMINSVNVTGTVAPTGSIYTIGTDGVGEVMCIGLADPTSGGIIGDAVVTVKCSAAPLWNFDSDGFKLGDTQLCLAVTSNEATGFNPLPSTPIALSNSILRECNVLEVGQRFVHEDQKIKWRPSTANGETSMCLKSKSCGGNIPGVPLSLWDNCDDSGCYDIVEFSPDLEKGESANTSITRGSLGGMIGGLLLLVIIILFVVWHEKGKQTHLKKRQAQDDAGMELDSFDLAGGVMTENPLRTIAELQLRTIALSEVWGIEHVAGHTHQEPLSNEVLQNVWGYDETDVDGITNGEYLSINNAEKEAFGTRTPAADDVWGVDTDEGEEFDQGHITEDEEAFDHMDQMVRRSGSPPLSPEPSMHAQGFMFAEETNEIGSTASRNSINSPSSNAYESVETGTFGFG
jgi:hypothetical protein